MSDRTTGDVRDPRIHPSLRVLLALAASVFGAALFALAFPPHGLWPLVFVGFVPVLVSLQRLMPPRYSGLALGLGVGGFFFAYFDGLFPGTALGIWLPLVIGVLAASVGSWEHRFNRRTGYRYLVPAGAAVWVSFEMIRGTLPFIGTWGFVSYALYEQPWLIQPVGIFSIYGLNLLIMLVNFTVASQVMGWMDRRWQFDHDARSIEAGALRRWTMAVAVALVAWVGLSLVLLGTAPPGLTAAALQPAGVTSMDQLFDLNREAAAAGAELIVWPEAFLPFDPQQQGTAEFAALARELGAYLVIGYAVKEDAGLRNEVTVVSPEGQFLGVFGKDHPVTIAGETSLTRGTYPTYQTGFGQLGTIICYDLDFTDTARKVTRNGAQIIAVPSADWPEIAHKHYTHIIFRAVENRVSMVKADVGYDSVIVDPYGRILARSVTTEAIQKVVGAPVPLGSGRTPVVWLGDWMGWAALIAALSFVLYDLFARPGQR